MQLNTKQNLLDMTESINGQCIDFVLSVKCLDIEADN